MQLSEAITLVTDRLVEHGLYQEFNGTESHINTELIEPALVFLAQQSSGVPFGAFLGAIAGMRQDKLEDAAYLLEALGDTDIVNVRCVNGNWIVYPLNIQGEIHISVGCDVEPIVTSQHTAFCGKLLHKPVATRTDHLDYMNNIKFRVNTDFLDAFPNIPDNVPFKRTLPGIIESFESVIYLKHVNCTRGRTYCGSHLNYQGTEWEKCLVEFHKKEQLNDMGRQNIANYIDGLKPKEKYLRHIAEKALMDGKTGMPLGADASNSGMQIMSMMRGCEKTATSVGILDKRNDGYTLADQMSQLTVPAGEDSRQVFKECCMQHSYGGVKTPREKLGKENLPKFYDTMMELFPGVEYLLHELKSVYWATSVFKWELPDGFVVQQPVIKTENVQLSLPSRPDVTFGYAFKTLIEKPMGLELAANVVHSVDGYIARELIYRASKGNELFGSMFMLAQMEKAIKQTGNYDNKGSVFSLYKLLTTPASKWSLLGKSFLEKAYAYGEAAAERNLEPFNVISIHDDFKSHPNYTHHVKWLYLEILADIADSTLVKEIIEQINPSVVYKYKPATKLATKVRKAYANGTAKGLT